ncbi:hypothetical protein C6499_13625 [Candidatus Poribacteria bacterium]|nr:MAG: hypothetical protein C6499_13625 [Candidatus Poribacteria bacterium]
MKSNKRIVPKRAIDLYPDVSQWLEVFLKDRFQRAEVDVHSLPHTPISRFLSTYDRGSFLGAWRSWNIKVDIVGFVHHTNKPTDLILVECKNTKLTLAHLSQLLGYSRIARPLYSFLISPVGFSRSLVSLLQEYHRHDVLEYHSEAGKLPRQVIVAQWEMTSRNLNRHTMIGGAGL